MTKLLCSFALLAASMFGADITGKWSGTVEMTREGESRSSTAYMVLKQEGTKITGTVGPNAERQYTIKTASIDADQITIEVEPEDGPAKVLFALKLDGEDRITGTMKAEGDQGTMDGKIDVKREK